MADATMITGDQYGVLEGFQELSKAYFPITTENTKIGLIGYINEIAAHVTKQSVFHRNTLYGEYFINTASIPASIYNFAIDDGMDIPHASPSKASIIFSLNLDILENYLSVNSIDEYRIERNTTSFDFDGIPFILPYSIKIKQFTNESTGRHSYNVVYDIAEFEISGDISDEYANVPFINTVTLADASGVNYLNLNVDVYQLQRIENENIIVTNNLSERLLFPIEFSDQLSSFNVEYKDNTLSDYINLPLFMNVDFTDDEIEYALYEHINENEYHIFFSNSDDKWRPLLNSNINIITYTTKGISGNFVFSGSIAFIDENPLVELNITCMVANDPAGGKDEPTLKELKTLIYKKRNQRDALNSDTDLNEYFSDVANSNFQNGSKVLFLRTRDDVIIREFSSYLLIVDDSNIPVSTNTVDIEIPVDYIDTHNLTIKTGSLVVYDSLNSQYRILLENEYPEDFTSDPDNFVYIIPFTIVLKLTPYFRGVYYDTHIDAILSLRFKFINQSENTFVINTINVERNPVISDYAQIRTSINSTLSYLDEAQNKNFRVLILFYNSFKNIGGYGELELNEDTADFFIDIPMNDEFNEYNQMISIQNGLTGVRSPTDGSLIDYQFDENTEYKIVILEKDVSGSYIIPDSANGDEYLDINNFLINLSSEFPNFVLKSIIIGQNTYINFFKSLDDILRSDITPKVDSTSIMVFKSVPVIAAHTFFNKQTYTNFLSSYKNYMVILRDNIYKLSNNTAVNVKFFNTYGVSYTFSTDRTNLSLVMSIERLGGYDRTFDSSVKQTIIDFVKDVNTSSSGRFSSSNLVTLLENSFSSIISCNVDTINGHYIRDVRKLTEATTEILTPEFISVGYKRGNPNLGDADVPNITINYI